MSPPSAGRASARDALLIAARKAFGKTGFEGAFLDEIADAAGVTKGSLYHHFASKAELFEAVYCAELERQVRHFRKAYAAASGDEWKRFSEACLAYLELIKEPAARRIAIVDASAVLGIKAFREIEDKLAIEPMKEAIRAAMIAGEISQRAVDPVAHFVFAAMCEAATQMDRAADLEIAHSVWTEELNRLLAAMR